MTSRTILILTLVASGCAGGSSSGESTSATPIAIASSDSGQRPRVLQAPRVPMTVRLFTVSGAAPGTLTLRCRVERRVPMDTAVDVQIHIPQGTTWISGTPTFTLAPNPTADVVDHDFVLRADSIPADDVVAEADVQGTSFGLHATERYRFGRPAPTGPVPANDGLPVVIGGRNFGMPVRAESNHSIGTAQSQQGSTAPVGTTAPADPDRRREP